MHKFNFLFILIFLSSCGQKKSSSPHQNIDGQEAQSTAVSPSVLAECTDDVNASCFEDYLRQTDAYANDQIIEREQAIVENRFYLLQEEKVDIFQLNQDQAPAKITSRFNVEKREHNCELENPGPIAVTYQRPGIMALNQHFQKQDINIEGNAERCQIKVIRPFAYAKIMNYLNDATVKSVDGMKYYTLRTGASGIGDPDQAFMYLRKQELGQDMEMVHYTFVLINELTRSIVHLKYLALPNDMSQEVFEGKITLLNQIETALGDRLIERLFGLRITTEGEARAHMHGLWAPIRTSVINRRGREMERSEDSSESFDAMLLHVSGLFRVTEDDQANAYVPFTTTHYPGPLRHRRYNEFTYMTADSLAPVFDVRYTNRSQIRLSIPRRMNREAGLPRRGRYSIKVDLIKYERLEDVSL